MPDYLSLYELNRKIREGYQSLFPSTQWVVAEISEINKHYSGHIYLELVEKDPSGKQILAKSRATIWAGNWRSIKPFFELNTGLELKSEMKILVSVNVTFHELYGHSLNILGIDPNYTLGDQARKRKEIIDQLIKDGVFEMNREIPFPEHPWRIALISSKTAAGYGDFYKQLHLNNRRLRFETTLFQSTMQGDSAVASILDSLYKIAEKSEHYDVLVIIRGGGSKAELSVFDSYDLASAVAQFPLPVLSGIGHDRDESILDMVAYHPFKTPTAVAEFLVSIASRNADILEEHAFNLKTLSLERIANEQQRLQKARDLFIITTKRLLAGQNHQLNLLQERFRNNSLSLIKQNRQKLIHFHLRTDHQVKLFTQVRKLDLQAKSKQLIRSLSVIFPNQNRQLKNFTQQLELIKPENLLRRGYSIATANGKIIKKASELQKGDLLQTRFIDGIASSRVDEIESLTNQK